MQAMRYDISLPTDYDMTIIRDRVKNTGHLMSGFQDLYVKIFMISEKSQGALSNSYSPLYVWKNTDGMSKFIFDGYFDNILTSFGWQHIEIGITTTVILADDFMSSCYVTEEVQDIQETNALKQVDCQDKLGDEETGKLVIYNPDKWKKVIYRFYKENPQTQHRCFEILYIAR